MATEVVVIADGSDCLTEKFGATVLKIALTGGPARARNLEAHQTLGEVLFFVDADITIHADAIS